MFRRLLFFFAVSGLIACLPTTGAAQEPTSAKSPDADAEAVAFFENRIRPVLSQECYDCHRTGDKMKGGLALDHRRGMRVGGDSGPAVLPGDPENSLLIRAIRHRDKTLKMPKSRGKLGEDVIADFERWIAGGAVDPRDEPPGDAEIAAATDWNAVLERRKSWWSLQPIQPPPIPDPVFPADSGHPVDRFIGAKLSDQGLRPAGRADRRTLIRRLSFALRGLPPSPEEIQAFLADQDDGAYRRLVDQFLNSPRFGERWARHWMDWVRYADSHGSEGDPMIPAAWRYRDYLIRALNQDVSHDQMLLEHLAGDLVDDPRIDQDLGLNESALATGHLRMVFHGFAPTDALDELVRFTDDQVNVLSKAFMGLTVSCARCHNHKFDAISQTDFYAIYGILASTRPGIIRVDAPAPESERRDRNRLSALKETIRSEVSALWLRATDQMPDALTDPESALAGAIGKAESVDDLLHPFHLLSGDKADPKALDKVWDAWRDRSEALTAHRTRSYPVRWDLADRTDAARWYSDGETTGAPAAAGEFAVVPDGDTVIAGVYPAGVYSHLLSSKDRGVMLSPRVDLDGAYDLWVAVAGDGGSTSRYAVQNYPRNGTVYPVTGLNGGSWRWLRYPLDYWEGDTIHVEVTTAADQPVLANLNRERSWFGLREAVLVNQGDPAPPTSMADHLEALLPWLTGTGNDEGDGDGRTVESLARGYAAAIRAAVEAWRDGAASDAQAMLLDAALRAGILPNRTDELRAVRPTLDLYREVEARLPVPTRAPGVLEGDGFDQRLFTRGNHKLPGETVPRRFLEVLDPTPYAIEPGRSGRMELARDLLRADNPLTSRVIVNRVWHHLFGRGIVATPDNFGRLGAKPTHPGLLDFLADWFVDHDRSIKKLIRFLVTSEAWRRASDPPDRAAEVDPDNQWLSHFRLRRLEAEAVRDALLEVAGTLTDTMYGPPVTGAAPRRSVYLRVKRNDLDPFLAAFDAPVPSSTKGRRDETNVPAQSLTLLNGGFVRDLAEQWAERLTPDDDAARVESMFVRAFGRPPSEAESEGALRFVRDVRDRRETEEAELRKARETLGVAQGRLAALDSTAKERVLNRRADRAESGASAATAVAAAAPLALWDFESDPRDQLGEMHGQLHGNARLEDGALVLDGEGSFLSTAPIPTDLTEKTLEAWVVLEDLSQSGGGVITVQTLNGSIFDSIVFAERQPRRWIAGSDSFRRTRDVDGPVEEEADQSPVHLAIAYSSDRTITVYRNGVPYGNPYRAAGLTDFEAGAAQVLLGNRHGAPGGNRLLRGRILEARLHDRALTPEEVAASAAGNQSFVSTRDLIAALTEEERRTRERLQSEVAALESRIGEMSRRITSGSAWADLAHAMFNMKEFIYVR